VNGIQAALIDLLCGRGDLVSGIHSAPVHNHLSPLRDQLRRYIKIQVKRIVRENDTSGAQWLTRAMRDSCNEFIDRSIALCIRVVRGYETGNPPDDVTQQRCIEQFLLMTHIWLRQECVRFAAQSVCLSCLRELRVALNRSYR